jgi:predicted nucleic acid-binding protein
MILVDSSVWIRHFRQTDRRLAALLDHQLAAMHPFVLGELACGNLRNRSTTIADMQLLPPASVASEGDVHHLLESRRLWGRGLGWIDMHLLASALLDRYRLWTHDQALAAAAADFGAGFP